MADRIVTWLANRHGEAFAEGYLEAVCDIAVVLGALALAALFVAS